MLKSNIEETFLELKKKKHLILKAQYLRILTQNDQQQNSHSQ